MTTGNEEEEDEKKLTPEEEKKLRLLRTETSSFETPIVGRVSFGSNWKNRRQTLAVFSFSLYFILPMIPFCWYWTIIYGMFPLTTLPVLLYLGYMFVWDVSPTSGSYRPWIRSWESWWSSACDYFPILLVKTAELPPDQSYVLGYHPHGIISVGALGAFATNGARTINLLEKGDGGDGVADDNDNDDGNNKRPPKEDRPRGFSSLFPGIDRRVITLPVNFNTPILREYILGMGSCNSDKQTFRTVLSKNAGKGNALVVVVGGAAESMLVKPGSIQLVLEKRQGFVREAIRANACLVPVLAFGETDLYHVIAEEEDHWVSRVQMWVKKTTGVAMPLFRGRSIFFRDFGVMPLRKPIVVVVGAPISPPKLESDDTVFDPLVDRKTQQAQNEHGKILMEWHEKYIKSLKELYQTHKDTTWNGPGKSRSASLVLVQ